MPNEIYMKGCKACKVSQGTLLRAGGNIELEGNWILNHYFGPEGFLGWMELRPKYHRMEFSELNEDEVRALGKNIQRIKLSLRNYWNYTFENDPIERVYIVYFFESVFDKRRTDCHLHIHLITRTKEIGKLLRHQNIIDFNINAWKIYCLASLPEEDIEGLQFNFWKIYKQRGREDVIGLMTYIRSVLFPA